MYRPTSLFLQSLTMSLIAIRRAPKSLCNSKPAAFQHSKPSWPSAMATPCEPRPICFSGPIDMMRTPSSSSCSLPSRQVSYKQAANRPRLEKACTSISNCSGNLIPCTFCDRMLMYLSFLFALIWVPFGWLLACEATSLGALRHIPLENGREELSQVSKYTENTTPTQTMQVVVKA